jgi:predicted helicase
MAMILRAMMTKTNPHNSTKQFLTVNMDLHKIFLRSPLNLFDEFIAECQKWYEQPAHTFTEMRTRANKKIRGDIFEEFSVLYLKHVKKYPNVWRLEDVPQEILEKLSLKRQDMGIDIICEKDGKYTAVQCKYKKHTGYKSKTIVTWAQLSTFYALCMRTGPWEKYVVMTNCDYVRHMGKKTAKDLSICQKTFQNITKEQWIQMCELEGNVVEAVTKQPTPDELRALRLARFAATA